ncbi:MAG: ATPase, family [Bacteroidota bacterium]|jgi:putative ATPase
MTLNTPSIPLAERMRPQQLKDYVGQTHLLGEGKPLKRLLDNGQMSSMIFWGPPGVGKTTLALLIANKLALPFFTLSAISSGVKEVREIIAKTEENGKALLFIDEIHRFNKSQQDALLGAVEKGNILLIGATTENPSFEVIRALLSRCQVYTLQALSEEELLGIVKNAIEEDAFFQTLKIELKESNALLNASGGDARKLLNILEMAVSQCDFEQEIIIDNQLIQNVVQQKSAAYDKNGEMHYDLISAFIKSIRGSDPNAALYYMARMIEGGEDPLFIARRLVILAAEDIGLANPNALLLANASFQSAHQIGWPESRIILSECVIYLATSPKSNSAYLAINQALAEVRNSGNIPVPLHLRNAPTSLMKNMGYGTNYQYAHDHPGHFAESELLPDAIKGKRFYQPAENPREKETREQLRKWWKGKYGY